MLPQKPPIPDHELDDWLAAHAMAVLCTHNDDGTIHATPIAYRYAEGRFLLGTQAESRRVRNIARDPNVTLVVDDRVGTLRAATVYGRARIETEEVIPERVRILEPLYGAEQAEDLLRFLEQQWTLVVVRITPDRIVSVDYTRDGWADRPANSRPTVGQQTDGSVATTA